ncbi:MAG: ATP-binding protein [Anaerolineae bacterium]|nr:ATP-binding protein [Candidatus Roseilinea sp.]MDW8449541.1 ATP-binding protein [Anaerolineae bacterium]
MIAKLGVTWRTHRPALLVTALALVLCTTTTVNRMNDVGKAFGGFLTDYDGLHFAYRVNAATPYWWPGIRESGLAPDDGILDLEGESYTRLPEHALWEEMLTRPQPVTLTVQRDGARLDIPVYVRRYSWNEYFDADAPVLAIMLCMGLIAFGVYAAHPTSAVNRMSALLILLIAAGVRLVEQPIFRDGMLTSQVAQLTWFAILPFIAALIVHFALLITRDAHDPNDVPHPAWLKVVYGLAGIVAAGSVGVALALWTRGWTPAIGWSDVVLRSIRFWMNVAAALFLIVRLIWAMRRGRKPEWLKSSLTSLLMGTLIMLLALAPLLLREATARPNTLFRLTDIRFLGLIVPLTFAFVVFRYQYLRVSAAVFWAVLVITTSVLAAFVVASFYRSVLPPDVIEGAGPLFFLPAFIALLVSGALWSYATAQREARLRQLPRRIVEARERERYAIRNELHDTTQAFLTGFRFHLEHARHAIAEDPTRAEAMLKRAAEELREAERELRRTLRNMAPMQTERGLIQPLEEMFRDFSARYHLPVHYNLSPDADALLGRTQRHELYRVLREALTNAHKHAQASQVWVALWATDGRVHFEVRDDGIGFDPDRAPSESQAHFGLRAMRDRIELIGGELTIRSAAGAGTVISGFVPAQPDKGAAGHDPAH